MLHLQDDNYIYMTDKNNSHLFIARSTRRSQRRTSFTTTGNYNFGLRSTIPSPNLLYQTGATLINVGLLIRSTLFGVLLFSLLFTAYIIYCLIRLFLVSAANCILKASESWRYIWICLYMFKIDLLVYHIIVFVYRGYRNKFNKI